MFTQQDLEQLQAHGITPEQVQTQMKKFETGFPFLKLAASATPGHGIQALSPADEQAAVERWQAYLAQGGNVAKFVPASGAASRMFKALFAFVNGNEETAPADSPVGKLLANLDKLPFLAELNATTLKLYGADAPALLAAGRHKDIIAAIILPEGMNYGALPKALLTFHRYADASTRTPLEEHLAEGAQTAASHGIVKLHFTVSHDHYDLFLNKLHTAVPAMEAKYGVKYDISISEQKPSTDTIAATLDNQPFRDDNGKLVFRPGGHGALIANLGDLDSDVVFIKNIDNVVPEGLRQSTITYKQVLAGVLILAHDKVAQFTQTLRSGKYTRADLDQMVDFMRSTLCITAPQFDLPDDQLAQFIAAKLNRPIRVCGMVRNDGEPGGGPFLATNADGSVSPQILESTQIDMNCPEYVDMMNHATHFNPVDLVCYIKDVDGNKYDLPAYVDHNTGFISSKSFSGRELRALELPGLWNGAMSDWSTIFVEVPSSTFNPVKTVNDLLRPAHQA